MPTKRAFGIGIMCLRPSCRPYRRPMSRLLSQGPKGGAANRSENNSDHNDIRDLELISQHVEGRGPCRSGSGHSAQQSRTGPIRGSSRGNLPTQADDPFCPEPSTQDKKGIAHASAEHGTIDPRTQHIPLQAIARSRSWMDAVLAGKTASSDEIASAEGLA